MYTFLGMVRVDFVSDKTGEQIRGWNLWLAEPAETPSVGLCPTKKWLSDEKAQAIFGALGGVAACQKFAAVTPMNQFFPEDGCIFPGQINVIVKKCIFAQYK